MLAAALAALLCSLALLALAVPSAPARGKACADAFAAPRTLTLWELRGSVLCLVNRARERGGLAPLRDNPALRRSATRHSADMVARRYFGHEGPRGGTVTERAARSGYLARRSTYSIGENIGGGVGRRFASPAAVYRSWMESASHRANILSSGFRDLGVGVVRGFPGGGGPGAATYTLDFGSRR
jgi:uncharacterized protein YkwD